MFRIAGELLSREGADFIVTGEVLGQRPMSQNRGSLDLIAKESGFADLVLRPLSARRLPITLPEKKGWINRDLLLDFYGRSRKPQMALARRLGIKDYPAPAGGCLLTEKVFSRRLKDLFDNMDDVLIRDIELLKVGRHFNVGPGAKVVVGRNERENKVIIAHARDRDRDIVLSVAGIPGPTTLVTGRNPSEFVRIAGSITAAYSDARQDEYVTVKIVSEGESFFIKTAVTEKKDFFSFMI
jgi:tRNA U34 2-thiouridine synthase MnmA/TrmU